MIRESKELQIGKAGEYLVCADLILKGYVAFQSEQGLPYDVLLDNGVKIIRIQVKTTEKPRQVPQRANSTKCYIFNIKRAGKKGRTRYTTNEIDMFALVCLDTMKIGYLLNNDMPDTLNIRVDSLKGCYYDEKGIKDYLLVQELRKSINNQSEISRITGLAVATVNRYCKDTHVPFETNARYFSDYERDKDWFLKI